MTFEELSLTPGEELGIENKAIRSAVQDELSTAPPIVHELATEEGAKQIVGDMVADYMARTGVSEEQARLDLAGFIALKRKERLNGEDF